MSADVALDSTEPVVGSFAADGLTYAVGPEGLTLVSADASAVADGTIAIPASVTFDGTAYDVTAVGPYAFYLSGAASVALPASVASVDERAFRSSDVAWVEVDPANETYASYDGALYDASLTRLLLIPGGRQGAVRIDRHAEVAEPQAFSHCAGVDAISVDAGSAAYASWDGLLYDASGTTLLRVPAGATDIAIRDGCASIAAGAMEGCAKLERINAPASITSISPDVFESVPTVSLPATSVAADSSGAEGEAEVSPRRVVTSSQGGGVEEAEGAFGSEVPTSPQPPSASSAESADTVASSLLDQAKESTDSALQLTAMVALSTADDDLPEVDPSSIEVTLPEGADAALWERFGFLSESTAARAPATLSQANVHKAAGNVIFYLQRSEVLYGLWVETGEYVNQNCAPVYNGWFYSGHGLNDESGHYFQLRWDDARGLYLRRSVGGLAAFDVWPATRATSVSLTPTGPDLVQGTYVGSGATVYFRTDNVIGWNPNGGTVGGIADPYYTYHSAGTSATSPQPSRPGYVFLGWYTEPTGGDRICGAGEQTDPIYTHDDYYAHWGQVVSFDTDSEPGDGDYPGDAVGDQTLAPNDGQVPIEDPKRPGYVFEGWVIPSADGTEAVDQDLVYQGDDGKWYVDASKLPDYAGDDGRVELTARWTSVISVDVPSSVTFYADLVTQGQESREGAVSSAFGQSKVSNQSEVDLRVVGLESSAVATTDTTLGADSVLKKASAATPSTSSQKLLSLYPSTKQWTAEELQDPDAVGGSKATTAVDFDLDDILLEKSFAADDFTIAAGDTLNMGYRLNLSETGQQLDYDKLSTLSEGQSASIANVSYCFAADALPSDWDEPLWIENPDRASNPAKYLLLKDIKAAADDLSANGTASEYYSLYKGLLDAGTDFHLKVDNAYYEVNILGICQDTRSDNGKRAGLTFGYRESFPSALSLMSGSDNLGGWQASGLRRWMRSSFMDMLGEALKDPATGIVGVNKPQQLGKGDGAGIQMTYGETIWEPSMFEVFGFTQSLYNEAEAASGAFQYQWFAKGGWTQGVPNMQAKKLYRSTEAHWWLRSARSSDSFYFALVTPSGEASATYAYTEAAILPCFCL